MGTGSSKLKKSKPQKVVAEIIVPGQSVPIKVKGQVNVPASNKVASHHVGAKVKEVGPNKFSIQLGSQDFATFNTDGDFHAYLTNAAELKVTNIETVPDEDDDGSGEANPSMLGTSYSFTLTPSSSDNYSDDEDWNDIINDIDSQSSSDEIDGVASDEAKQRKTQLKKALQAKRANLSPEEYQQMIANHKQEMELMEMLRQKELDRQKNSLASKVADRKKKRLARKEEAMQKDQLTTQVTNTEVEKALEKQNIEVEESEMEILKLHVLTQTNAEIEEEINQRNNEFDEQMRNVRPFISEKEYRKLLLQHKAHVSALSRKLEIGKDNQRIHLMEKLAQRCKRKASNDMKTEKPLSSEEVKELQLALNTKEVDFRKELTRTRSTLTNQESERLIKEHKEEMQDLQQQLEKDRTNMQQDLMARLEARMKNDMSQEGRFLSLEDLKQLQLVIDTRSQAANDELKKQKNKLSKDDYSKLMTKQRNEKEALQRLLETEKAKTDEWLKRKMTARSLKIKSSNSKWTNVIAATTNQQLEVELKQRKESWEKDKKEKRSVLSQEEYDALMKQHREEVNQLEKRLNRQTDAQRQHLLDKLAERRAKKNKNAMAMTADEVKEMQLAIAGKDVSFKAEIKVIKGEKSSEEVQKLIDQHKEEMNSFQKQLDIERERMREKLLQQVAARQKKGLSDEDESLTEEEIKQSQVALDGRDTLFKENIKQTKSALTSEDYQRLLDNHLTEQRQLQEHLEKEREKMNASLNEKLTNRHSRAKKTGDQGVNTADIQAEMDAARARFEKQSKKNMTDEEYQRLLQEHEREMTRLQGLLDSSLDRQKLHMMDRLEARRRKKALVNAEEEEKQRLLLLLGKDNLTLDEIEQVIDDLEEYEVAAQEDLEAKRSQISEEEYQKLIASHQKDMEAFQGKLDEQKKRMGAKLAARLAARSRIQTELQKAEEEMQEFSVLESSVDISSVEITQLWTTPVQSKALVVVPLSEEYPVRKKRQLYTDAAIFRHLDAHAIKLAQTGSLVTYPTFSALVDELMRIGTSELEKARLAFRWITAQNCEEMDLSEVVDDTPLGVLKGIYFNKINFSTLFMRMCRFIGLRCVEINGCAKVKGYKPGMFISLEDHEYLHTWNAVRIDGHWHFVDCNWGVSHIAGSVTFDPFRFEYDEHYFLADPEVIIATHFPNEGAWQLVPQPLTLHQFNGGVVLKPDFFKFDFQLLNFQQAVVPVTTGNLDLRIGHPRGFILSCKVASLDRERDTTLNGISFDQFVFVHQVAENQMSIYVRFPEIGKFFLVVYAKKQYVDGQVNIETETEICRYHVICDAPSIDQYPLPSSPADHWGPIGVGNAGLVPVTHRTAVIISNGEPITIGFKFSQHLIFHHELTCQEKEALMLQSYVMHRKFNGNVLFTITPPHASRYAVNIFITYPNDPQQQKVHLCSYLLVVNAIEGTDVPPIPISSTEHWGETRAFTNLGLTALSHPDPFISVPSDDSLSIKIGVSEVVFLQHRLEYYCDKSFSDLTSTAYAQSSQKGCITFLLHLPNKGYYVFKLLGSNSNEEGMPMSLCFDYLIKRC